jgi:AraC-like DNA-binding protein
VSVTADSPRHDIDVTVFASPLVRVGRWRCPSDHPLFVDSGPSSDALFVFPREGVWIEHDGNDPFVADANTVTYYNKGQCYRRRKLSTRGDQCEWFAVAPETIAETLSAHEPAAIDRWQTPFPFTRGPSNPESYLRQRMVFQHVCSEATPDRLFVEEAVLSILADVTQLAYVQKRARPTARTRHRRNIDLIESARDVIARRFTDNLSLSDIAREIDSSVFHLARVFKVGTGVSLHVYRNQLRLRSAFERLHDPTVSLIDIALDLGFSSHSHFTETFRRSFARTPSAIRGCL